MNAMRPTHDRPEEPLVVGALAVPENRAHRPVTDSGQGGMGGRVLNVGT